MQIFHFLEEYKIFMMMKERIGSPKKELPTHNSFDKELKESVLQLTTPESLAL